MIRISFSKAAVSTFFLSALFANLTVADVGELISRIPPGANCIVYINVDTLFSSKIGKSEDWRGKLADTSTTKPLIVPPDAKLMLMASWFEPAYLDSIWDVSLIEVSKTISMERIAHETGGFKEGLGDKMAAWSPMNAYFVRLDKNLLGVVSPADRQFASRWSAQTGKASLTPYLREALDSINAQTDCMIAMDLQDAISPKRVRQRIDMEEFECLTGKKLDARKVSDAISSITGLTLTINAKSDISGKCDITFSQPVSVINSIAKPLMIEILEKAGASIGDFDSWKFTDSGSAITAKGSLSTDGLRQILSIINPPTPPDTDESQHATDAGAKNNSDSAAATAAQAAASKRYYRSVAKILDTFGKRVQTATSLSKGATYVARDARSIGRLSMLNVDPDLLKWGTGVSASLLDVASSLGAGGLNARARAESIMNPNVSGNFSSDLEIQSDPNDDINRQNAARQRRAAVAEEKARALQQATRVLMDLQASSSQIRAAMTQKYNVEF